MSGIAVILFCHPLLWLWGHLCGSVALTIVIGFADILRIIQV